MGGDAKIRVSKRKIDNLCTIIGCIIALVCIGLGLGLVNLVASVPEISYLIFAHVSLAILLASGGICIGIYITRTLYLWLTGEEMKKEDKKEKNND